VFEQKYLSRLIKNECGRGDGETRVRESQYISNEISKTSHG